MAKSSVQPDWERLAFNLGLVFKPTTPINREDLFAGRISQIRAVLDVINQAGQHAVLYGERGVGKTSLANMILPKLYSLGLPKLACKINCVSDDTYGSIWKRVFAEINFQCESTESGIPKKAAKLVRDYTDHFADNPNPDIVRRVLFELGQEYIVIVVLDEFDTVSEPASRRATADTIKYLSDSNTPATTVLIGVADDVQSLIDNHASVERCLSQILMPRMTRDELEQIVTKGLSQYEMTIDKSALHEISRFSRGLPNYTHLLGLLSGRASVDSHSLTVTESHVSQATRIAIDQTQASIQSDYSRSTTSARKDAMFKQVLLAAAMAETDELGYFYPKSVQRHLERILGREVGIDTYNRHLKAFCAEEKGAILKIDESTARPRYRFRNALLEPYVLIRGMADGMLTEDDLRVTRDPNDPQGRLF